MHTLPLSSKPALFAPIWLFRGPVALNLCCLSALPKTLIIERMEEIAIEVQKRKKVRKVIRLYGAEWDKVNADAKDHCTKLGTYLRYATLNNQAYFYKIDPSDTLDEMRAISKSINTIAKKFNEVGYISAGDVKQLREDVTALGSILNDFVSQIKPIKIN